ncbi:MAG: TetR/AcrR family transcriptional regulator [Chloroherpetonaceae bacterium]|nr:TetR/AcrR family transcriptional regulator [Chloroherpetonaceae bacterium]MDW8438823.1 TetR/AcrR family transcriptional regulator [Chloroherpetonaceae bacterium]
MSVSERKEREKEQRRQEILRAAKTVFFRNGFEKTSMEMVAEECQLAKGTLYLYFKSKEELYLSLVEDGIRILDEMMEKTIAKPLRADEKLLALAQTYFRFTQSHNEHFTIFKMIDVGTLNGKVDQEKLDEIQRLRMAAFERMEEVVAEAIRQGAFQTTHKPREIVMMLWAATFGAIMMCADKCQQLDMFKEVHAEKFVMRIASALIESFRTANVQEEPLGRENERKRKTQKTVEETEPQKSF